MSNECTKKNSSYVFPSLDLLNPVEKTESKRFDSTVRDQRRKLERVFEDFRVNGKVIGVTRGPSVTRFEIEPAPGVKVSSFVFLADDIIGIEELLTSGTSKVYDAEIL